MIDLCLIVTPIPELLDDQLEPPLGYLYLASSNLEFEIKIVDLCDDVSLDVIPEAQFYGFSTYTTNYARTLEIRDYLSEKYPKSLFIAGGAHATALPYETLKKFDFVVRGEGEVSLKNILLGAGKGVYAGEPIVELDTIPFPDYSMIDIEKYHRHFDEKKSFSVLSSRGCPYKCVYCNSLVMGGHKPTRFRTPKNVWAEIESLRQRYGEIGIRFQDDIFGLHINWLREFAMLGNITFRAFVRVTQCSFEFVDLLHRCGCQHVSLGVESGSDRILKAMKKGQTRKQIEVGIRNLKNAGIVVRVYLIVGFPGENSYTLEETIDLMEAVRPDEYAVYPLIPYPGSEILVNAAKYGIRNVDTNYAKYFQVKGDNESEFVYDLDYIDRNGLQAMKDYLIERLEKAGSKLAVKSRII